MLYLYLFDQNCLHRTSTPYLCIETYSRKYEKLPNIVTHTCNNITEIRLCLFTSRPIARKQLNSLTATDSLSWLGGAEVTHPLWVREIPGLIPAPARVFMINFLFCCCCVVTFLFKTHYLSQYFAISFAKWPSNHIDVYMYPSNVNIMHL